MPFGGGPSPQAHLAAHSHLNIPSWRPHVTKAWGVAPAVVHAAFVAHDFATHAGRSDRRDSARLAVVVLGLAMTALAVFGCRGPQATLETRPGEGSKVVVPDSNAPFVAVSSSEAPAESRGAALALRLGYSSEPGTREWAIVEKQGHFARLGAPVELVELEHYAALEAYSAGRLDGVATTNADVLENRSLGAPCTVIAANWSSQTSGALLARQPVRSILELKGGKIGVELGQPEHCMLERLLTGAGLGVDEVNLINLVPELAQRELKAKTLEAVMLPHPASPPPVWAGRGVTILEGPSPEPLLYGVLCVRPTSLTTRRDQWQRVVNAWLETQFQQVRGPITLSTSDRPLSASALLAATKQLHECLERTRGLRGDAFATEDFALLR